MSASPSVRFRRLYRSIVAISPGTVGQEVQCAPSKFIENVADPSAPGAVVAQYELRLAYELTRRGVNAVMTDYQGLGVNTGTLHPYMNRKAMGTSVLDSFRAAAELPGVRSTLDSAVGAWGYSQGGGGAAAAAEMAESYSPDLNFMAVYSGAVPADLADTLGRIDGSVLSGAIGYAINGIGSIYPEVRPLIDANINDLGAVATQCLFQTAAQFGLHTTSDYTLTGEPLLNILQRMPEATEVLAANRLGNTAPSGTVWLDSATSDGIVSYPQAAELAASWCREGGRTKFMPQQLPDVFPRSGVGHLLPQNFEFGAAEDWLILQLQGQFDGGNCAG